jgi:hypothetical protein
LEESKGTTYKNKKQTIVENIVKLSDEAMAEPII